MKKKKVILIVLLLIVIIGIAIKVESSNIINWVNGMYLEKPNPEYSSSSLDAPNGSFIVVPFGEVATSRQFDFQILEVSEKMAIKVKNKTYTPKPDNKYVMIKLKVRNSSNSPFDLYYCNFVLRDITNLEKSYTYMGGRGIVYKISEEENDKNFTGFDVDLNPGLVKYTYILLQVPESCELDNLVLEYAFTTHFKLK